MPRLTVSELDALDAHAFTDYLATIYEHSPWIPERAAARRPFGSRAALQAALAATLDAASAAEQLALICAHPELAGKAALRGELTEDSQREQAGAGLDQCSPAELAEVQRLNHAYRERFGMPFIIAVKGLHRSDILAALQRRLAHDAQRERTEALAQIQRIAALRLADRVAD
jgi:2-oxo-4-hydroxy-4-carboxy-5-ureidoimidazoline decarboxylase